MHVGVQTWGSCFITDAGIDGPDPYDRHHTPADFERAYHAFLAWAKQADQLGYESFWVTEHHFQREGYEIIPNPLMLGAILAQHTRRLKFGAFFLQVPSWHPIRLAEDFAMADIMSGGRILFGAGRGSVQREMPIFGATFGRNGDDTDRANRALFEEQMTIIKRAWSSPEFSHQGERYSVPVPGYLNTGSPVHRPPLGHGVAGASAHASAVDLPGCHQRADAALRGPGTPRGRHPAVQPQGDATEVATPGRTHVRVPAARGPPGRGSHAGGPRPHRGQ